MHRTYVYVRNIYAKIYRIKKVQYSKYYLVGKT